MQTLTRNEVQNKLSNREPVTLLEALPARYYRDGHLPGALHMPHDQVDALAARLLPDKSAEIVVYCASNTCQNSTVAARRLAQLGYTNVAVYPGGKAEWQDAGLPLERSAGEMVA